MTFPTAILFLLITSSSPALTPATSIGEVFVQNTTEDPLAENAAAATEFDLSWHSADGGGTSSANGGDFHATGTSGQADAGAATGEDYALTSGFWAVLLSDEKPIFSDGFESGDVSAWSRAVGATTAFPVNQ